MRYETGTAAAQIVENLRLRMTMMNKDPANHYRWSLLSASIMGDYSQGYLTNKTAEKLHRELNAIHYPHCNLHSQS